MSLMLWLLISTNAAATFQRYMNVVFAGVKWVSCLVFQDDILVLSNTLSDHLQDLREILTRIRIFGLSLKRKKCGFCKKKIFYLGHEISDSGIRPNPV